MTDDLLSDQIEAINLASSGGRHIPGTSYDWRHTWIPLTSSAAQSHFRGHVPASWKPRAGSLSTGEDKGKGTAMKTDEPASPSKITGRDLSKIRRQTGLDMGHPDAYMLGPAKPDYAEALGHLAAGRNAEALAAMDRMVAHSKGAGNKHLPRAAESMRDKVRTALGKSGLTPALPPPAGKEDPAEASARRFREKQEAERVQAAKDRAQSDRDTAAMLKREREAGESNARGMDRMMAHRTAQRTHLGESTGLAIPDEGQFGLGGATSDFRQAVDHLLAGRHTEGIAALDRAIAYKKASFGKVTKAEQSRRDKLQKFRDQVAAATTNPKATLPALARVRGGPSGMTAIDHQGNEYKVALKSGQITVTHNGQTASAPAGSNPTQTARQLAGQLRAAGTGKPALSRPTPAARKLDRAEAKQRDAEAAYQAANAAYQAALAAATTSGGGFDPRSPAAQKAERLRQPMLDAKAAQSKARLSVLGLQTAAP